MPRPDIDSGRCDWWGRVVSLCNDNLRNGSAVIVMSGVAAMVTASAGSVVRA